MSGEGARVRTTQAFVEERVGELAAECAVFVRYLDSGRVVSVNPDVAMETMSVIKLAIFLELMIGSASVSPDLSGYIDVTSSDFRLGTGVLRKLTGARLALEDVARLMITESDNTATDICLRAVGGPDVVNRGMAARGLDDLRLGGWAAEWFRALAVHMDPSGEYASMSDAEIAARGYPLSDKLALLRARREFSERPPRYFGVGTARALAGLVERVWHGDYGSEIACRRLLDVMKNTSEKGRIARRLWACDVYNKSGSFYPHVVNDVGVVVPLEGEPFVMAMLINRFNGGLAVAEDAIADIAQCCTWAASS